jgi:hypothetical protein
LDTANLKTSPTIGWVALSHLRDVDSIGERKSEKYAWDPTALGQVSFIGAGVGAIAGAANGSAGGAGCVFDVIVFVPLLGVVGAGVGVVVDPFLHGKTVYRSPDFSAPPTVARP